MNTSRLLLLIAALTVSGGFASAQEPAAPFASFLELPWRYVIGGHDKGRWLDSEAAGKRLAKPKTTYRVFTLKGEQPPVTATGAAPEADVCQDVWMMEVTPAPEEMPHAIGISAAWEPMPRRAKFAATTQEAYVKAVTALLTERGIRAPKVEIKQLLRVDLDGDGEDEVLLSATHYTNAAELISPLAGDYSFVALRRVVAGKVVTQIIEGEFYPKADENAAPNTFEVSGLLDLDGDGKLEVLVNSAYYEGGGTTVWRLNQDTLEKVMEIFCGV